MGALSVVKNLPKIIVHTINKTGFMLKRAKPQILVGGGLVIATGAFVLAIVNARKIDSEMAIAEAKIDDLEAKKAEALDENNGLSEEERNNVIAVCNKDIRKAKNESVLKMAELIGVPSMAFLGGIAMIVGGHRILLMRFGQVSASLAALKESYDRYRQMNIAEHGEECDRRYRYGIVDNVPGTEKVTDETGKEKTVKTLTPVVDPQHRGGLYSFVFSEEFSRKCPKEPVNTISFLRSQEKYWNVWMQATGKPVTLSMVLEDLGIELDPDDPMNDYILIAGWRPNGDGDNVIDFGIMRAINKRTLDMQENVVMLDFNCDGNLYHSSRYDKHGRKVC